MTGLNAKKKEYSGGTRKDVDPLESGTYPARLVQVIDLGVQEQQPFKGDPKPPAQEIMVTYEFSDEFMKDDDGEDIEDKPRWLSETFPLHSLNSDLAKSTKRYYALDPDCEEEGDWTQLTGRPVMVTIVQNRNDKTGKVYNNIKGTSPMRAKEAAKLPDLKNPSKVFDQSNVETLDIMLTLPEWIQNKIKEGLEWEGSAMDKALRSRGKDEGKKEEKAAKKEAKKPAAKQQEEETESTDEDW